MGAAGSGHQPVLTDRVLALLGPALDRPGAVVLDGTLGRAGHALALLREHPGVSLIGVDTDGSARSPVTRLAPSSSAIDTYPEQSVR